MIFVLKKNNFILTVSSDLNRIRILYTYKHIYIYEIMNWDILHGILSGSCTSTGRILLL